MLLAKLRLLGVCHQLIAWIECFITQRYMQVRISGSLSHPRQVSSGVPQGSVLGPVLFLIYVNYAVSNLECSYKLFADDIKLYLCRETKNEPLYEQRLQRDIDNLVATSESWGLHMNSSKGVCIRFGGRTPTEIVSPYKIKGTNISFVESHGDLGIEVSRTLKFHSHIRKTTGMCHGITTNILASTLCRDSEFVLNIYMSHIRPKLEYGSTLWNQGYAMDLRLLEGVQRRWTRSVSGLEDVPYPERLRRLDLFSVQGRLLRADMIMTWKIFNGKCAIDPDQLFIMNETGRRGHPLKIFHTQVNCDVRKRSFAVRVVSNWNSLAADTVMAQSLTSFKGLLHRDLASKLYECCL